MKSEDPQSEPVKTSRTVFEVIEGVKENEEVTASELAEHLDRPISSVYDHLATLVNLGYLIRADQHYRLGLKFLELGICARQHVQIGPIESHLNELAERTGETAWFVVEENGWAVHIERSFGEHGVPTADRIGRRSHLHLHAGGKAILAHLSEESAREIIANRGLPASTEHTITDEDALFEELEQVRERGVALNDNEEIVGVRSVAAPIVVDGEVFGAISIGGPAYRIKDDRFREELPELVRGVVNETELQLRYGRDA